MKKIHLFFALVLFVIPVAAQIRGNNIEISVYPDHNDWTYKVGETAKFTVEVRK